MTYSPFPEAELRRLAEEYETTANQVGPKMREFYTARAVMLRNAIICHEALRERCLSSELALGQARHALDLLREAEAA